MREMAEVASAPLLTEQSLSQLKLFTTWSSTQVPSDDNSH